MMIFKENIERLGVGDCGVEMFCYIRGVELQAAV